jgi:methylenetetrahydrofolate/methylenetetrahydromethanopterin dehydrogenase (NADP+)
MEKQTILLQLDTDALPSVFDRVVAVDAGAQQVFSYGGVTPENVAALVHGCIFTRGPKDLHRTAIFVGGSDSAAAGELFKAVKKLLLPQYGLTVSCMADPNGANTTAAAAVRAAGAHLSLGTARSLVLGATGPVGQRVVKLLAAAGGNVRVGSRDLAKAEKVAAFVRTAIPGAGVEAVAVNGSDDAPAALAGRDLVVAAGAPGAVLLPRRIREKVAGLKVVIDLNGVPPAGIEGVEPMDRGTVRDGQHCYGALGVGGNKMKAHKAAIKKLFEVNNLILDLDEIYELTPEF